ncbi:LysR substrate-binding domain-containing protein [Streptomyces albidoflavus]|uniref:LysR substrate-binding domain-containing protein n=1 Tax=Streptomyces albidoflavus TaxID=1886 RepID=UPI001F0BB201|nr:LysR substrate-binding domain-containing protein [Streptomyces albidoflavus]
MRLSEPDDPLARIAEGRAGLGLVVRPDAPPLPGLDLVRLLDDPYRVVFHPDHPPAGREAVELADLAKEPWIGSEPPGPCLHAVLQGCAAAGFTPEVAVECQDYTPAQGFVAAGLGIALLPRLGLAVPRPGVAVRPVRGPEPARTVRAALRSGAPPAPALTGLLTAPREAAGPLGDPFFRTSVRELRRGAAHRAARSLVPGTSPGAPPVARARAGTLPS